MTDEVKVSIPSIEIKSMVIKFKCRLTLGPALIDFEGSLEETVQIITRLTQEFTKQNIIIGTQV